MRKHTRFVIPSLVAIVLLGVAIWSVKSPLAKEFVHLKSQLPRISSLEQSSPDPQRIQISTGVVPEPAKKQTPSQASDKSSMPSQQRTFTGAQFQSLYESINYSGVQAIIQPPSIRGDEGADNRIRQLAESRGYKLRAEAKCKCLQQPSTIAFQQMKKAAAQDGFNLVLVSGFRSIADQRSLFLGEITGISNASIASGAADNDINAVLKTRSIPGYSRHHTGYTIDLGCNSSDLLGFKNTACFQWISANNYANAKRFGFIPSYPDGVLQQGPDPEQWEYVWVGQERLT